MTLAKSLPTLEQYVASSVIIPSEIKKSHRTLKFPKTEGVYAGLNKIITNYKSNFSNETNLNPEISETINSIYKTLGGRKTWINRVKDIKDKIGDSSRKGSLAYLLNDAVKSGNLTTEEANERISYVREMVDTSLKNNKYLKETYGNSLKNTGFFENAYKSIKSLEETVSPIALEETVKEPTEETPPPVISKEPLSSVKRKSNTNYRHIDFSCKLNTPGFFKRVFDKLDRAFNPGYNSPIHNKLVPVILPNNLLAHVTKKQARELTGPKPLFKRIYESLFKI